MIEQRPSFLHDLEDQILDGYFPQGRSLIEISDDLSSQHPEIVNVLANGLARKVLLDQIAEKGRKQATIFSPGGMS